MSESRSTIAMFLNHLLAVLRWTRPLRHLRTQHSDCEGDFWLHWHIAIFSHDLNRLADSLHRCPLPKKWNRNWMMTSLTLLERSHRHHRGTLRIAAALKAGTFKWGFSFASSVPVSFCSHLVFHTRKHCVSSQLGCVTAVASDPEVWIIVSITLPTACHNTQKKAVKSRSPADTFLWFTTLDWANVEKLKHEEETKKLKLCSLAGTSGPHRGVRKSRETF